MGTPLEEATVDTEDTEATEVTEAMEAMEVTEVTVVMETGTLTEAMVALDTTMASEILGIPEVMDLVTEMVSEALVTAHMAALPDRIFAPMVHHIFIEIF